MQAIIDNATSDVDIQTDNSSDSNHTKTTPGKEEILYNLLYSGKISMEEYTFLMKKKIEPSVG